MSTRRRFLLVLIINVVVCALEAASGIYSGSWSMVSDSAHVGIHVFAALVGFISECRFKGLQQYVMRRFGALTIILLFFPLAIFMAHEAFERLSSPPSLRIGVSFFIIAVLGLIANIAATLILKEAHGHNHGPAHEHYERINARRGLFWHMLFDAAGSTLVIVGGVFMYYTQDYGIDPPLSLGLAAIIFASAIVMLRGFYRTSKK